MARRAKRRPAFLLGSALCAVLSGIAFGGVILGDDLVGRLIFGVVWAALGIVWFGVYLGGFSGEQTAPRKDGESR